MHICQQIRNLSITILYPTLSIFFQIESEFRRSPASPMRKWLSFSSRFTNFLKTCSSFPLNSKTSNLPTPLWLQVPLWWFCFFFIKSPIVGYGGPVREVVLVFFNRFREVSNTTYSSTSTINSLLQFPAFKLSIWKQIKTSMKHFVSK